MKVFPEGFMWGVSTAGHQIEGNNLFSDWYEWEKKGKVKNGDTSEIAAGSWDNFERDISALKTLGVNSYRYSIEWARVEPKINAFDETAIDKYRQFTGELVENGIKPVLTLHHFVNPRWFAELGGWENKENIRYFKRYVDKMVKALGEYVDIWITINEPNVYATMSYLFGEWPPEMKDFGRTLNIMRNFITAHAEAYDIIKAELPGSIVSVALNVMPIIPLRKMNLLDRLSSSFMNRIYNYSFFDSIMKGRLIRPVGKGDEMPDIKGKIDFLGLNYYTRAFAKYSRPLPEILYGDGEKTEMGYEFYPGGLGKMVTEVYKRYGLPVLVTENGIADSKDEKRWRYINEALESVHKSISNGTEVMGYMYWSLMDNFEWKEGYEMKFGFYETDRNSLTLKPRPSAANYAETIKNNFIE